MNKSDIDRGGGGGGGSAAATTIVANISSLVAYVTHYYADLNNNNPSQSNHHNHHNYHHLEISANNSSRLIYSLSQSAYSLGNRSETIATATTTKQEDVPNSTIYMSLIAYALIFAIGFFGNALVILVAYCSRAQLNSTHYCLVNLSVADLLLIIVCMPSAVIDLFSKEVWYLGFFMCKLCFRL